MESPMKSLIEYTGKIEEEGGGGKVCYKLVPWLTWDEWNFVRKNLLSSSPDSIAAALARISAWQIRGCTPIQIEVAANIIETQQKDPVFRKDLNKDVSISEELLAMLYSTAIIRLVNGIVDKGRKKEDISIAERAAQLGLPPMLIDIRHEASHRDLPSLQLVRVASVEVLDWIKSTYWEPQKKKVSFSFHKNKVDYVRKTIKSKLHELAFHLDLKLASQLDSRPLKRKRNKQLNVNFGRYNHFSRMVEKLQGSHSRGSKKQITKIFGSLLRVYTSFSLEVVAVLLDFLVTTYDSSDGESVEPFDDSEVDPISESSQTQTGISDLCKFVITRLSSKEPTFILIMLKKLLETLETQETSTSKTSELLSSPLSRGRVSLSCSQSKAEIHKKERLSSLVMWLIEIYDEVMPPSQIVSRPEFQDSSAKTNVVSNVALADLLKKCLLVSSPDNSQFARSALLLAQIMGKRSLVEKLKKLPTICSPNMDFAPDADHTGSKCIIIQQESSITRAREMLDSLKRCQSKDKGASIVESSGKERMNQDRWTVAKSWNPCPIGMLSCSLGSKGVLPVLDRAINLPEVQNVPQRKEIWELNRCGGHGNNAELLEKTYAIKDGMVVEDGQANNQDSLLEPFKGQLMIDGVYKKVRAEELLAIESSVRILV
ncbi:las1-like family protein [Thalictrum thalictroides]|uniref:Las1-like family protein n=1 Tax=Thalictrum thalictroides TaxID=46969 RepID=A0A7J6WLV0_THATH|nr:las1-like family protein [Thalictrum thalictroides]